MTEKEKLILSLLSDAPMTMPEITEKTAIRPRLLREIIGNMKSEKLIRVKRWEKTCGAYRPVFDIGCAPDIPKPDAEKRIIIQRENAAIFKRTEMDEWLFRARAAA